MTRLYMSYLADGTKTCHCNICTFFPDVSPMAHLQRLVSQLAYMGWWNNLMTNHAALQIEQQTLHGDAVKQHGKLCVASLSSWWHGQFKMFSLVTRSFSLSSSKKFLWHIVCLLSLIKIMHQQIFWQSAHTCHSLVSSSESLLLWKERRKISAGV